MNPEEMMAAAIQQAEEELAAKEAAELLEQQRVPKIVNDEDDNPEYQRLLRMAEVAGKFASTLVLKPVGVHIHHPDYHNPSQAPAWSDESNIWFAEDMVGDLSDPKIVVSTKGLTLHEVAHIMLTPRNGSKLIKEIRKAKVWQAFNALEDQRIETFMVSRFSNVSDWLTGTIAQHIINSPKSIPVALPLVYGRKYLPATLRSQIAKLYENQADVPRLTQLIDEYIVLNLADPKNYDKALQIVIEFDKLVMNLPPENTGWNQRDGWGRVGQADPNNHNTRKQGSWGSGNKVDKSEQQRIADKVAKSNPTMPPLDTNPEPTDPGSNGSGQSDDGNAVKEVLEDIVNQVHKRRAEEIVDTIARYNGESGINGKHVPTPPRHQGGYGVQNEAVDVNAIGAATSFARELQLLKAEYDPGWNKFQENGRLNVQRYALGCEVEEAFDTWDMGRDDAIDIECVIALDISGSMSGNLRGAYQSMWAIKRALDKVSAATTVVTFGSTANLLYDSSERAGTKMKYTGTNGGTSPRDALEFSRYKLSQSKRAIKLFIAITDGYWDDSDANNKIIRELRRGGVLTSLAYISTGWWGEPGGKPETIDSHGCQVAVHIEQMSDLFTLAKRMVKVGITNNLSD